MNLDCPDNNVLKNVIDEIIEKIVDEHVENVVNQLKRFGELYDFEIVTEPVTDKEWHNITSKD